MTSLPTEIGIMIAILVGAWAAKVAAIAVYLFCHRRRLRQLAASGERLPTACHCHKPTPQAVITSLPVIPYAAAVQQLKAGHCGSSGAKQGPPKPAAAAAAAAAATATAADTSRHQDQQQVDTAAKLDQQPPQAQSAPSSAAQEHQDLRKSSAFSLSAAAGADAVGAAAGQHALRAQPLTGGTEAECCPICFGEYDSAAVQVKQLPCRHYFHPECIDAWLVRDNTCPLCKALVWVPDSTATAAAAVDDASQQHLQQQHGQGHRHVLRVIVIGGPLPRQQQA